jgi:ATP-dependent RNA helicase SUPV3L1/SUV3
MSLDLANRIRNVTAVLGPTNTGKTHLAIERMLGHDTGLIGLPLRLLAREVYDKIAAASAPTRSRSSPARRRSSRRARATTCAPSRRCRARPMSISAIDEVQLAADPERGHVFTDRCCTCAAAGDAAARRPDHARGDLRSHSRRQLHIASAACRS